MEYINYDQLRIGDTVKDMFDYSAKVVLITKSGVSLRYDKDGVILYVEKYDLLREYYLYKHRSNIVGKKYCPLCGADGDDLLFAFYCTNGMCKNFNSSTRNRV